MTMANVIPDYFVRVNKNPIYLHKKQFSQKFGKQSSIKRHFNITNKLKVEETMKA